MGNTFPLHQKTASNQSTNTVHTVEIRFSDCFPCPCRGLVDKESPEEVWWVMGTIPMQTTRAKYSLGQVLRHRKHPFRGVVFDVDAIFSNTEEWYDNIPVDSRPSRDQPFYHLLAENDQSYYVAYVSEQNLVPDETGEPVDHPDLSDLFGDFEDGRYPLGFQLN